MNKYSKKIAPTVTNRLILDYHNNTKVSGDPEAVKNLNDKVQQIEKSYIKKDADIKVGSEDNKKSLEVYGTTRLKGEVKLSKGVTGENINVKGINKLEVNTINTNGDVLAFSLTAGDTTIDGELNLNGTLNMGGHDITEVESITVDGTGRFDTVKARYLKGDEPGDEMIKVQDIALIKNDIIEIQETINNINPEVTSEQIVTALKEVTEDISLDDSASLTFGLGDALATIQNDLFHIHNEYGDDYDYTKIMSGCIDVGNFSYADEGPNTEMYVRINSEGVIVTQDKQVHPTSAHVLITDDDVIIRKNGRDYKLSSLFGL